MPSRNRLSAPQRSSSLPWYYKVKIRPEYDPAELVTRIKKPGRRTKHAFETGDRARQDTDKTIRSLETAPVIGRELLLPILRSCNPPREPCGLTICRVCMRQYRRAMASELLPHLHREYDKGYRPFFATLIYSDPKLRSPKLRPHVIKSLPQRLRMLLKDYELNRLMIAGSIELDWNEKDGVWEPHCHLIIMGKSKWTLKRKLKKYFKRENGVKQPTRISEEVPLAELPRALVYSLKLDPKLRVGREKGERKRTKRPPIQGYEWYKVTRALGMSEPDAFAYRQRLHLVGTTGPRPRIEVTDE